jgi:hypothetical protein
MLSALLLALLPAFPPEAKEPPAKKELFAKEEWYRTQAGKEESFIGVLQKLERKGGLVGFGRFNPYRLVMDEGKGKKTVREVYVGGKMELLAPYVGKRLRLIGKAVDMEVEGQNHHEIWPARLEVQAEPKADPSESPARKAQGGEEQEAAATPAKVKVLAETPQRLVPAKDGKPLVLRSGAELVKAMGGKRDEDAATSELAKALKVKDIDWKNQMVVVLDGGVRPTGGFSVQVTGLEVKDDVLTVRWMVKGPPPGSFVTQALTRPSKILLVERFGGTVRFDPAAAPGGIRKPE